MSPLKYKGPTLCTWQTVKNLTLVTNKAKIYFLYWFSKKYERPINNINAGLLEMNDNNEKLQWIDMHAIYA